MLNLFSVYLRDRRYWWLLEFSTLLKLISKSYSGTQNKDCLVKSQINYEHCAKAETRWNRKGNQTLIPPINKPGNIEERKLINPFTNDKFYTLQNRKNLQTTISNFIKISGCS